MGHCEREVPTPSGSVALMGLMLSWSSGAGIEVWARPRMVLRLAVGPTIHNDDQQLSDRYGPQARDRVARDPF